MNKKVSIIVASVFSMVLADQAAADNVGAAFVGGMIGGAIGSAIANGSRKSYSGSSRKKAAAPAGPSWNSSPSLDGLMSVTNGQGVSFTYDVSGQPLVIITPSAVIPPAAINTMTPVSLAVDGRAFGVVQAEVRANGLYISDVQVIALEQRLRPGHKLEVASIFATWTVSLTGFTKAIEQLSMFRQQQVILASTAGGGGAASSAGGDTTVVQVQVNNASQASASNSSSEPDGNTTQVASLETQQTLDLGNPDEVNKRIGELQVEIEILSNVLVEQKSEEGSTQDADAKATIEETIASIESRIEILTQEFDEKNKKFNVYLTSVKPNDKDLYITARKSSQVFPKVPYYIPGTKEEGEFWLEPKVTNVGELMFNFRLIDTSAENDTTRNLIEMNLDQLENTKTALVKLGKNSRIAHENKVRKNYAKRLTCFPAEQCPEERQNGEKGKSSTEVIFLIYEDGSTAGRLQLNKGAFQEGVNFSIDSGLLLQAYLSHVIKEGKLEFKSGQQTEEKLDEMFQ